MKTETNEVVEPVVVRERAVSCLVGHAPPAREDDTLPIPIERPQGPFRYQSEHRGKVAVDDEGRCEGVDGPAELVDDDGAEDISRDI